MKLNKNILFKTALLSVAITAESLTSQAIASTTLVSETLFSPINSSYQQHAASLSKAETAYMEAQREVDLQLEIVNGKLAFPEQTTLNLFSGESFSLQVKRREWSSTNNVEIIYGYIFDSGFDHIEDYSNVIFTINHDTGKLSGLIETEFSSYLVQPSENGRYNIIKQRMPETIDQPVLPEKNWEVSKFVAESIEAKGETDKKGNTIIDVLKFHHFN